MKFGMSSMSVIFAPCDTERVTRVRRSFGVNKPFSQSADERVSAVLKSKLEQQLVEEKDAVVLAGHGSHVVTQDFSPEDRIGMNSDVEWDDQRFDGFIDRLGSLDKSEKS